MACCSFCSIVPPHILHHIAESDDEVLRRRAREALALSERLRGERMLVGGTISSVPSGTKRRAVYDAHNTTSLPGALVREEIGAPSEDPVVERAFQGAGETFDFYQSVYGRTSIDDRGLRLDSTVHFGVRFDNAFWNGRQMVYGDGDGVIFRDFTSCLDVVGHELTHGVTEHEAGLEYYDQPGALNESMSDVFGVLVKQWSLGQDAQQADWLVGAGLLGPTIHGVALRSMKAPGTAYDDPRLGRDPQPAHMRDFIVTSDDDGGVHINSGIPNHAFYVTAVELGGRAWEKAGAIWYDALTRFLRPDSTFEMAAAAATAAAAARFGRGSLEEQAVRRGWAEVGVPAASTEGSAVQT
jgi:Zn-dependent metalloprotease